MGKSESGQHVALVCVRAAHHRHMVEAPRLRDVDGWRGYCPAGDIGGHDWMSTATDLATLRHLGYCWGPASDEVAGAERDDDDALVLTRS